MSFRTPPTATRARGARRPAAPASPPPRPPWRGDTPTPSSCPASFLHVAHQLLRPALVRLEHAERFIGQARQVDLTEAPRLTPPARRSAASPPCRRPPEASSPDVWASYAPPDHPTA